ncbi:hypothetical protein ACOKM5_23285 [Streptomyces sp. BH097]|uniref:hypothetical protein n=1 Tax=unclassified Streptomyces TaxID=2593676 RepID=UPI003BB7A828
MTPHDRLAAEEVPTGTFGHARPPRPADARVRPGPTWSATEQAQHCADLLAAIDGWVWGDNRRADERRHLRLIEDEAA